MVKRCIMCSVMLRPTFQWKESTSVSLASDPNDLPQNKRQPDILRRFFVKVLTKMWYILLVLHLSIESFDLIKNKTRATIHTNFGPKKWRNFGVFFAIGNRVFYSPPKMIWRPSAVLVNDFKKFSNYLPNHRLYVNAAFPLTCARRGPAVDFLFNPFRCYRQRYF